MRFATTFDEYVPLERRLAIERKPVRRVMTNFESVLSREALVTMATRKGLHSQMNALVPLEIVVTVETLRALIALEWPVVLWRLLRWVLGVHLLHRGGVAAVECRHHPAG